MKELAADNLFHGKKVRLTCDEPAVHAKAWTRWQRNSELERMLHDEPAMMLSQKTIEGLLEKGQEKVNPEVFSFHIHPMEDDRLIGFINLRVSSWEHGEAWLGMAIGDREDWNKGYGTDALQIVLRYAFEELNLHRVTLGVYEYNQRGVRAYEKAGFRIEGVERACVRREGVNHDGFIMGILKSEWLALRAV